MVNNLEKFGRKLKELRINEDLTLREACRQADYDPSNWSKIERGKLPPPSNEETLREWAELLGIERSEKIQEFVDQARAVQGAIPKDILEQEEVVEYLPAFFRTLRNEKPTKEEIDRLVRIIKEIKGK